MSKLIIFSYYSRHFYLLNLQKVFSEMLYLIINCTIYCQTISSTRKAGVHSSTLPGKDCQQNTAANINGVRNVISAFEGEGKYLMYLS